MGTPPRGAGWGLLGCLPGAPAVTAYIPLLATSQGSQSSLQNPHTADAFDAQQCMSHKRTDAQLSTWNHMKYLKHTLTLTD